MIEKLRLWLRDACSIAQHSKATPDDRVGAIAIGPDKESKGFGWNGIPRGIEERPEQNVKPEAAYWWEHAERNLIYNAARQVLKGSTLFVTKFPCADCARGIIQCGFVKVVSPPIEPGRTWSASQARAELMFKQAGIEVVIMENV